MPVGGALHTQAGALKTTRGAVGLGENIVVIDDFEDTPILDDWTAVGSGDHAATTTSAQVWNGSQALESTGFDQTYLAVGGDRQYAKGEGTLYFHFRAGTGDSIAPWFRFGAADNNNSYYVVADSDSGVVAIAKETSGTTATLTENTTVTITGEDWHEAAITWDDGTLGGSNGDITYTLTNLDTATEVDTLSANDTTSALQTNVYPGLVTQGFATGEAQYTDYIVKAVA